MKTSAQQRTSPGPPGNRVRLGLVGFGVQGAKLASAAAQAPGVEIAAVADVYDTRLARAREMFGDACATARDYRAVLARRDVDAIIIATPDHLHVPIALSAIDAGKDVYVESPAAHSEAQAAAFVAAASRSDRVVACATGDVAPRLVARAREIVSSGRIGAVTAVTAWWGTSGVVDAWMASFPPDASPETIGYDAFLARTPRRDFDLKRFFRWRGYWDYGGGLAAARFAPLLTAIDAVIGANTPSRIVAGGRLHRWKDGRETPDVLTAVIDDRDGPTVTLSATLNAPTGMGVRIEGGDGTLALENTRITVHRGDSAAEAYGDVAETLPKEYRDWYYMMHGMTSQGQLRAVPSLDAAVEEYRLPDGTAPPLASALADFTAAVRTRSRSSDSLDRAVRASIAASRINVAYREKPS